MPVLTKATGGVDVDVPAPVVPVAVPVVEVSIKEVWFDRRRYPASAVTCGSNSGIAGPAANICAPF